MFIEETIITEVIADEPKDKKPEWGHYGLGDNNWKGNTPRDDSGKWEVIDNQGDEEWEPNNAGGKAGGHVAKRFREEIIVPQHRPEVILPSHHSRPEVVVPTTRPHVGHVGHTGHQAHVGHVGHHGHHLSLIHI